MRNLFCKRLAACMCMKQPSSGSLEPPLLYRNVWSVDIGDKNDRQQHYLTMPYSAASTETDEVKKLLKRLCRLLENRARREDEQSYEADKQRRQDDKEDEMKNDWMLAAAVLDRICAILITVIFIVGTVVLFVIFFAHP